MSFIHKTGLIGVALAAGLSVATSVAAETKLRMANWLPPVHHMQKTLALWAEEVSKATNGEVTIELMKAPLAPAPGQYDLVKNGAVDIAYGIAAFTPKRFNLYRGMEMPFMFQSAETASAAHWEWIKANGIDEKEFGDTKLLATFTHAPFLIHATKPVTSLADLDGMKVRAGGYGIEIFKRLGAVPVFIPPAGTTEAIERGTVDATQFTWESLLGFRLTETATHHLEIPQGLYGTAFWITMSKRSWDKLTSEQQAAIEGIGMSGSKLIGARWDAVEGAGRKAAMDNGNTITTLGDADTAKLREATAFVEEGWVKAANDAGLDGQAMIDDLKARIAAQD